PKSPAPQAIAEARPKTTTARPGPAGSAVGGPRGDGLRGVVDFRRTLEGDDRVGGRVVAIGRRQVDHLEVAGDLAEELQRAHRTGVVEGHERIVEDERRPSI